MGARHGGQGGKGGQAGGGQQAEGGDWAGVASEGVEEGGGGEAPDLRGGAPLLHCGLGELTRRTGPPHWTDDTSTLLYYWTADNFTLLYYWTADTFTLLLWLLCAGAL